MKPLRLLRHEIDETTHPPPPIDLDSIPFAFVVGLDPRWPANSTGASASEPTSEDVDKISEQTQPPTATAAARSPNPAAKRGTLSAEELAKLLKRDVKTVSRRKKAGKLPAPLPGEGRDKWDRDEIDRWLEAGSPPRDEWEKLKRSDR